MAAGYTPLANSLQVAFVIASATVAGSPTMTGGSLTWTRRVVTQNNIAGIAGDWVIFSAPVGASPASTTPTFDCTGDAATGCIISVVQFTGYDDTLANPLRQSYIDGGATTSTNAKVTFPLAVLAGNGYFGCWGGTLTAPNSVQPTDWTEADDIAYASPSVNMGSAYRAGGEISVGPFTFTSASTSWYSMGVEVWAKAVPNKEQIIMQAVKRSYYY
jgi:hypothetical protein